jgi:hypothetical protein
MENAWGKPGEHGQKHKKKINGGGPRGERGKAKEAMENAWQEHLGKRQRAIKTLEIALGASRAE